VIGYQSASAFSTAFSSETGRAPKEFMRALCTDVAGHAEKPRNRSSRHEDEDHEAFARGRGHRERRTSAGGMVTVLESTVLLTQPPPSAPPVVPIGEHRPYAGTDKEVRSSPPTPA
jgi:hypothetical protein